MLSYNMKSKFLLSVNKKKIYFKKGEIKKCDQYNGVEAGREKQRNIILGESEIFLIK